MRSFCDRDGFWLTKLVATHFITKLVLSLSTRLSEEDTNTIILSCQYLDRGVTRIALKGVCDSSCLEILFNHVIEYVVSSYDEGKKACCYEIHLKKLSETAKVWAESMEFL